MITVDVLMVGDATDGPSETILPVDSIDQMVRLYGGYLYERVALASGQTTYTVAATPWGNEVVPYQEQSDGFLVPLRLFEFAVSGAVLTWNALGAAQTAVFRTTAVPGPTSVLKGILAARRVGLRVHAVRLGGTSAAAGPSGNFTFTARYPGARYNGTTIFVSGGAVVITPTKGTGRATTYLPASDHDLAAQMRNDVARGWIGCGITGPFSTSQLTVPSGTYALSGGTDGAMSASGLLQFMQDYDLSGADVICPVGIDTTACSGAGVPQFIDTEMTYPALVVAQAPLSGAALAALPNPFRQVCSVGFQTTYDQGGVRERVDDAAPLVAAIIGSHRSGITLAALPEFPVVPHYDTATLHAITSGGHTVAYKSISKGWALWQVDTGDANWTVSTYRAYQEIARPVYTILESAIGQPRVTLDDLHSQLQIAFSQVVASKVVQWTLTMQGDTLYCDLLFQPYGEVRTISASLALGTPQAAQPV